MTYYLDLGHATLYSANEVTLGILASPLFRRMTRVVLRFELINFYCKVSAEY
jgi:hypothetical protein